MLQSVSRTEWEVRRRLPAHTYRIECQFSTGCIGSTRMWISLCWKSFCDFTFGALSPGTPTTYLPTTFHSPHIRLTCACTQDALTKWFHLQTGNSAVGLIKTQKNHWVSADFLDISNEFYLYCLHSRHKTSHSLPINWPDASGARICSPVLTCYCLLLQLYHFYTFTSLKTLHALAIVWIEEWH